MSVKPTSQQSSEHEHIQEVLQKTKTFGIAWSIFELVVFLAFGFLILSFRYPYFIDQVLPSIIGATMFCLSALIILPAVMAGPLTLGAFIIVNLITLLCLIVSICYLIRLVNLKSPKQGYKLAIYSIIFNILPFLLIILALKFSLLLQ